MFGVRFGVNAVRGSVWAIVLAKRPGTGGSSRHIGRIILVLKGLLGLIMGAVPALVSGLLLSDCFWFVSLFCFVFIADGVQAAVMVLVRWMYA